jgi:hypothetical protein
MVTSRPLDTGVPDCLRSDVNNVITMYETLATRTNEMKQWISCEYLLSHGQFC